MNNEKINEIKSLDQYFPKGHRERGNALVLVAEAFLLGKDCAHNDITRLEVIEKGERRLVKWNCKVEQSLQDKGRTSKLFVSDS